MDASALIPQPSWMRRQDFYAYIGGLGWVGLGDEFAITSSDGVIACAVVTEVHGNGAVVLAEIARVRPVALGEREGGGWR